MDGFGWALAASGTLCRSKVQDSNDEACSEVAEVRYKVRGREATKKARRSDRTIKIFGMCFVGRETILLILTIYLTVATKNASKKTGKRPARFLLSKTAGLAPSTCRDGSLELPF